MISNAEAEYLLGLEKVLANPNQIVDLNNKKNRLEILSFEDLEHKFLLEITSNKKILLKTSIHHLESQSFIGLLRIDFRGGHHNPSVVHKDLPDRLIPYVNKWFGIDEPHMHVFVQGYKPLAWAIPLSDTNFPVKDIFEASDVGNLIINFAKEINLKSIINIQQAIL